MDAQTSVTFDQFLASLGAGTVHSSGAFTISEDAAREKLARYTLIHPSLYVLELVATAVLGEATVFEVTTPGGATHYRFDGQPLTAQQCQQALGQMFESSSSRRLGCLGLGLSAAHSAAGADLTLQLEEGVFSFDGTSLMPLGPAETTTGTEIRVPGRYGFLGTMFRRDATLEETLGLCRCAPLKLTLDGLHLAGGWSPNASYLTGALLHWTHPQHPLTWTDAGVKPFCTQPSPGDFSALIAIQPAEEARVNGLTIIHQGIAYRSHDPAFAIPGICAVVMTNQLERNLSRSEILWNQAYKELLETLREGVRSLVWASMRSPHRLRSTLRRCRPTVQWVFDNCPRRQDSAEFQQTASWLATVARLEATTTPQTLSDLALENARLGKKRQAEDLHLAAIEMLIEAFRQSGQRRDLAVNLAIWTPLLRDLIYQVKDPEQQSALRGFLALVTPMHETEKPTVGQRILHYRLQGQPKRAAKLLKDWDDPFLFSDRVPIEILLALPRSKDALDKLLHLLGCADVEAAFNMHWYAYRLRHLDLLADILEYLNHPKAIEARQLCLKQTYTPDMRYLASLELCRQTRAKGQLALWVKHRAQASMLSMSKAMWVIESLEKELPTIVSVLDRRAPLPADLDEFLLPLCDVCGGDSQQFPYLVDRLAHRLRLEGEYIKADQVLARAYSLRAMDASLYRL